MSTPDTMNNQTVKIHWRFAEDFPTEDGSYLVCARDRNGEFMEPVMTRFERGDWEIFEGEAYPEFWTNVPLPKVD